MEGRGEPGGGQAGRLWLQTAPRPTGVICFTDTLVAGFVQVLISEGVSIPAEVSVCGVDDTPLAAAAAVPLTTLRAPAEEMGGLAARQLMDGGEAANKTMHWKWVPRCSTGKAPSEESK